MEFMAVADEVVDLIPEGVYLKMAGAAKSVFDVIEELDPHTVDDFEIQNEHMHYQNTQQDHIATLKEEILRLRENLEYSEACIERANRDNYNLNLKIKSLSKYLKMRVNSNIKLADRLQFHCCHWVCGQHIAHMNVIRELNSWFKTINASNFIHWPHQFMRSTNFFEGYKRTEFTEGFGATGVRLEDMHF